MSFEDSENLVADRCLTFIVEIVTNHFLYVLHHLKHFSLAINLIAISIPSELSGIQWKRIKWLRHMTSDPPTLSEWLRRKKETKKSF